jgi:DNA-binding transcriptional ArsR family regulator
LALTRRVRGVRAPASVVLLALLAASAIAGGTSEEAHATKHETPIPPSPSDAARLGELAGTALAAGSVAALAGLGAFAWPRLKPLLAAPLFTRIERDEVLANETRARMHALITGEPGIHGHAIADHLQLGWSTTVYHLRVLERSGLLRSRQEGRYKCYFVTGDERLHHTAAVVLLRQPTSRAIMDTVAARPGLIQKEVCGVLGVSSALASWHLQRLERAGLVRSERQGRSVAYTPGPAWDAVQGLRQPAPTRRPAPRETRS